MWWTAVCYLRPVFDDRTDVGCRLAENQWEVAASNGVVGRRALLVTPRDAPYALWPFRLEPDGDPIGWYCNLQRPLVRTDRGFDTDDWTLDIWAEAGLSRAGGGRTRTS